MNRSFFWYTFIYVIMIIRWTFFEFSIVHKIVFSCIFSNPRTPETVIKYNPILICKICNLNVVEKLGILTENRHRLTEVKFKVKLVQIKQTNDKAYVCINCYSLLSEGFIPNPFLSLVLQYSSLLVARSFSSSLFHCFPH